MGMALETASLDRTAPGAGLGKLVPMALRSLPEKPSVSVLITCFNYGAYVGQAIESALEQTYPPSEIIVSDDESHDNSCEVVESYINRGLGIKLLRNPHGGMAANLNAAYRNCTGDVICLLDADDTFLPAKVGANPTKKLTIKNIGLGVLTVTLDESGIAPPFTITAPSDAHRVAIPRDTSVEEPKPYSFF